MLIDKRGDSLPFLFSTIIIAAAIITTTMIKLHYIKNEDASIVYDYDCYNNSFDKKNAVDWILSQGYELVGERRGAFLLYNDFIHTKD